MNTAVTTPLSPGTHTVSVGGVAQRHHVAGAGPVCLAHPGGPGLSWEYLRMPAGAELVLLEKSGHLGHVEEPDAFARAVTAFVAATD
ncbi:alpha/beta hydrolase [Nonomuraea sp. B19D2]|uniref:alpha/beta fold hydrolase n=1 Tax=Nonomuraea sp. B19D2 TaxID=3159561 RepID=UPI0032DA6716